MWCLAVGLLLLGAVSAEVVDSSSCIVSGNEPAPAPNCTINQVRISPCAGGKPCAIKRGRSASIEFDFTTTVGADNLTGVVYWASPAGDLPFLGMNTDGCTFTTCPIVAGFSQTYKYDLKISKTFPARIYKIKWRVWKEQENILECCFTTNIRLVK